MSVKVKFRPSSVQGREGTVYYQITKGRRIRQLLTNYRLYPSEWDSKRGMPVAGVEEPRKSYVTDVIAKIRWDLDRLMKILRGYEFSALDFSADDVAEAFIDYTRKYTLFNYMEFQIARIRKAGKARTSETYTSALKSFRTFREGEDIMLDCLTADLMEDYANWLHNNREVVPNTISFYARILRAVYNRALDDEAITDRRPFRRVYTGIDKTVKRALPFNLIKQLRDLDLSDRPSLDYARDMFMLSFMLRGMSMVDMSFLKKSDLRNGRVSYRRRKTGQLLTIEWTEEMQAILDKYPENPTCYLLPIIREKVEDERKSYRSLGYKINKSLKEIANMLQIEESLTLYVARHSWASAAKAQGVPVSVISEGMGHNSEQTTRIYLSTLDTTSVDSANALLLKSL